MRLFKIQNIGRFMTGLLSEKESYFDNFLLREATIAVGNTYSIDGHINKDFYSSEELEALRADALENGRIYSEDFIRWEHIKGYCFSIIKGRKTPLSFKIVFYLAPENVNRFLQSLDTALTCADIGALALNIKYDGSNLTVTSATSLKIFTLDKSLENSFDDMVAKFLASMNLNFE